MAPSKVTGSWVRVEGGSVPLWLSQEGLMSCIFGRLRYVSGRFGGMTIFGALVWSVWDGAKLVKNRGFGNAPRFVSRRMEPAIVQPKVPG